MDNQVGIVFPIIWTCQVFILVYIVYWAIWTHKRIEKTSKFRHKLIDFVYYFDGNCLSCTERNKWYKSLPSHEKMSSLRWNAPFISKPLDQMIDGEYKETFLNWMKEQE